MIFDAEEFARKYAVRYTAILAVLLIVPLFVYIFLLLQIDKAKVSISLENQSRHIINSMQQYNNKDKIYNFPRYKAFQSALYDQKYKIIFSTLTFEPNAFTAGFHNEGQYDYYIYVLPADQYFGAKYLLVSTKHSANKIYYFAALVMVAIIVLLFIFSFLLLRNFSKPFQNVNMQLDDFIKDSMHEINTPLSIITLNADLFENKHGNNKYLKRMKSASKILATIYNDMDYLVKQGRVEHKSEMINIGNFIQNRIDYFQEISNLKGIAIERKIAKDITYYFSRIKLQRIVDNTISNAIKYSHNDNKIEIVLEDNKETIVFWVKDYGVGIEKPDKIFSRYYRENQTRGGFGIGLNIVKHIIDEEGIKLDVESSFGVGSLFKYTFYK